MFNNKKEPAVELILLLFFVKLLICWCNDLLFSNPHTSPVIDHGSAVDIHYLTQSSSYVRF
jgi:hypothetical protein